jgi:hypothetical protein
VRTRFTSLSPSGDRLLMSVRMMSNLLARVFAQPVDAVARLGDLQLLHAGERRRAAGASSRVLDDGSWNSGKEDDTGASHSRRF